MPTSPRAGAADHVVFLDAHLTHAEPATARARTDRFVSPYPTPDRDPGETLTHALATAIDRMLACSPMPRPPRTGSEPA